MNHPFYNVLTFVFLVSKMRWTWITGIVLFFVAVLMLAFSLPAGAFNGVGTYGTYGTYGSTSSYNSGLDGSVSGGWSQTGWPYQQQFQSPVSGGQYPYNYPGGGYQGGGYFSNCYSRCIAQGYGTNYCAQVCPV